MKAKGIFLSTALPAVFFMAAVAANAEIYIKQTRHTDPFTVMGQTQPEKNETIVTWLAKDRARIDTGEETSVIVIPAENIMRTLKHEDMTYMETPLDSQNVFGAIPEGKQSEEAKKALEMAGEIAKGFMQSIEVKVTETGETKRIKNWNCRKYLVEMSMPLGKSRSTTWATEDIHVNQQLYRMASNAGMAAQQGFQKIIKEMQKIKGVIVYQETKGEAMGSEVRTVEEVVELSEKPAPAGAFGVPRGYKNIR
ncbi:MAG: DUF4412 domain-containing protein [Acidobacteria bacterium]|nr:DUF4412 domain-containing protein [Acidobacteriota bacterium]